MNHKLAHDGRGETLDELRRLLDQGYAIYTSDPICSSGVFTKARKPELVVIVLEEESGANVLHQIVDVAYGKATVLYLANSARHQNHLRPTAPVYSGTLTAREQEVIQLVVRGFSMKAIARRLNITPRTVAFHKYKAMENNGLRNNVELVAFAARHGLAHLPISATNLQILAAD